MRSLQSVPLRGRQLRRLPQNFLLAAYQRTLKLLLPLFSYATGRYLLDGAAARDQPKAAAASRKGNRQQKGAFV